MGLAQAIKGVVIMCYPIIVQFLQEKYGYRGTMAVLTAVSSHTIFAMILMHPVEWHLKTIKVPVDESEPRKKNLTFIFQESGIIFMLTILSF